MTWTLLDKRRAVVVQGELVRCGRGVLVSHPCHRRAVSLHLAVPAKDEERPPPTVPCFPPTQEAQRRRRHHSTGLPPRTTATLPQPLPSSPPPQPTDSTAGVFEAKHVPHSCTRRGRRMPGSAATAVDRMTSHIWGIGEAERGGPIATDIQTRISSRWCHQHHRQKHKLCVDAAARRRAAAQSRADRGDQHAQRPICALFRRRQWNVEAA